MITNTIASPEFRNLLANLLASPACDFEVHKRHLIAYIDSWGLKLQRKAVEDFKAVCKFQDQVACDEKALDAVLKAVAIPRELQSQFERIKRDTFETKVQVPKDLTPEFTIKDDDDLNALLNDTAALIDHGGMDIGISWSDSLERVLNRLKQIPPDRELDEMDEAAVQRGLNKIKLFDLINVLLGKDTLQEVRAGAKALEHIRARSQWMELFDGMEQVFKTSIHDEDRKALMAKTGNDLVAYVEAVKPGLTMSEIPKDGVNPYADHPGFEATNCPLRLTVTQRGVYGGIARAGFACLMTGGHCLPGEYCDERRARAASAADLSVEELLDRVGIESRLSKIAIQYFARTQWKRYQDNDSPFGVLVTVSDDGEEYDDYSDFDMELKAEFHLLDPLVTDKPTHDALMRMTYVELVNELIKKGAK